MQKKSEKEKKNRRGFLLYGTWSSKQVMYVGTYVSNIVTKPGQINGG